MTNSFEELTKTRCLFVIGSNTTVSHPMVGMRLMQCKREGGTLIVVDPRRTDLARQADLHLRLKPGTDIALVNGIMHIIYTQGWHNAAFIEERTEGFTVLEESLPEWTPEKTEEITGVPKELIFKAAESYARSETAAIVYCLGITQHSCGVDNVRTLANLAMLCGQIGRPYTGVNPLRGQNNVQGACDMGALPDYYSGYQRVEDAACRAKFEKAWGRSLPAHAGLTALEMMHGLEEGRLKGMIIMGENPVVSDPDAGHAIKALKSAEFLLCIDIFPTPTTDLAHLILPGASYAESEGTFTNSERRVQRVRRAARPLAGMDNAAIIQRLSQSLGYDMGQKDNHEVFAEMASLSPLMGGMSHARLDEEELCWPCPTLDHPGTPILHQERFTRGKGLFSRTDHVQPAELPCEEYPLLLSTGMRRAHYLTGTMTRRCSMLERELPELVTDINPIDAKKMGIYEGATIRMVSRRGAVITRMHITDDVPQGVVFAPLHFAEANVNLLTNGTLDPISKTPEYKISAVRLEKV